MGGGSVKKRRGAGNRGGRGFAGGHKHKWSTVVKYDRDRFGKFRFPRPQQARFATNFVNVGQLDNSSDKWLEEKSVTMDDNKVFIEAGKMGFEKVLGAGKVTRPMKVVAKSFSESAKRKLEEAGGEAVVG